MIVEVSLVDVYHYHDKIYPALYISLSDLPDNSDLKPFFLFLNTGGSSISMFSYKRIKTIASIQIDDINDKDWIDKIKNLLNN